LDERTKNCAAYFGFCFFFFLERDEAAKLTSKVEKRYFCSYCILFNLYVSKFLEFLKHKLRLIEPICLENVKHAFSINSYMELAKEKLKIQAFKHLVALWETIGLCSLFGFCTGEGKTV